MSPRRCHLRILTDAPTPELLSEQQLSALLPPSVRYLLAQATHRHPRYLIRILNNFDEVYALLQILVERHFLHSHLGTFTENFYGLKRERVLRVKPPDGLNHALPRAQLGAPAEIRETLKLRERDVWSNLLVSVGIPYLKRKLDESFDIHAAPQSSAILGPSFGQQNSLPPDASLKQRFLHYYKWFLRHVYPSVNAAYYFALLAFQLAYLFDASRFHDPFLWLIGTRVRRLGEADHRAQLQAEAAAATAATRRANARPGLAKSLFDPRLFTESIWPKLLSGLQWVLPTSIFALKFLEWWHASDFARQLARKASEGLELPPPILSVKPPPQKASSPKQQPSNGEKEGSPKSAIKSVANSPPLSRITGLPILTVPATPTPPAESTYAPTELCPICVQPIQTATASPYGHVFCYQCIHRWVDGLHERQARFMEGGVDLGETAWDATEFDHDEKAEVKATGSREGRWESGKGRCAVTGLRILGGTGGLRRVVA